MSARCRESVSGSRQHSSHRLGKWCGLLLARSSSRSGAIAGRATERSSAHSSLSASSGSAAKRLAEASAPCVPGGSHTGALRHGEVGSPSACRARSAQRTETALRARSVFALTLARHDSTLPSIGKPASRATETERAIEGAASALVSVADLKTAVASALGHSSVRSSSGPSQSCIKLATRSASSSTTTGQSSNSVSRSSSAVSCRSKLAASAAASAWSASVVHVSSLRRRAASESSESLLTRSSRPTTRSKFGKVTSLTGNAPSSPSKTGSSVTTRAAATRLSRTDPESLALCSRIVDSCRDSVVRFFFAESHAASSASRASCSAPSPAAARAPTIPRARTTLRELWLPRSLAAALALPPTSRAGRINSC
eukprot:scaffold1139_cov62-Phaeocystis_antarctica.AAC.6